MKTKKDILPTQEQIDDLSAWIDDLEPDQQRAIETLPDTIDILPDFCRKWSLNDIWSVIRDDLLL